MNNFDNVWPLMQSLWPHADLGDGFELRNLYRDRLSQCRPELLETAIKDVRANYSSKTPELKWILERYRKLLQEWRSNQESPTLTDSEDPEKEMIREIEADRSRISFNLSLLSEEELCDLREEIARRPFLRSFAGRLGGPPDEWTHFQRGIAWALHTSLLSDQSQDHSQGQEPPG
tara:strand:+ start:2117 stop:2641 length:525 start_codon:yes stop_codon:yes gene_type:complete